MLWMQKEVHSMHHINVMILNTLSNSPVKFVSLIVIFSISFIILLLSLQ